MGVARVYNKGKEGGAKKGAVTVVRVFVSGKRCVVMLKREFLHQETYRLTEHEAASDQGNQSQCSPPPELKF